MNSVGELLSGAGPTTAAEMRRAAWAVAMGASKDFFARERIYRAGLAVTIFAELDLSATSPYEADRAAMKRADEAKRTYRTAPICHKLQVQQRVDLRNPDSPLDWFPVEFAPVDPNDPGSPRAWRVVR